MILTVKRIENSWRYDVPGYPEAGFEVCTLGTNKGKTFMISGNKVAEVNVLESYKVRTPFREVSVVDKIEIVRENLDYNEIFFEVARKTKFVIEDEDGYEGYTFNRDWNGWEMPMFEKEVAMQLMNDVNNIGSSLRISYDEEQDTFFMQDDEYEGEDYGVKGHDILGEDGQNHHVYDIGAGSWVWMEKTEEEDEDNE